VINTVINTVINHVILYLYEKTMGRRPVEENNIRSITKSSGGRSYTVTIPMEMIKQLEWRAKQKVVVQLKGEKIIIEDWRG
jgi:hypothetical protein